MRAGRVALVVLSALVGSLAFGLIVAGAGLGWAWSTGRTANGYFEAPAVTLETDGAAIVSPRIDLGSRPDDWVPIGDPIDLRIGAEASEISQLFIGIGPTSAVEAYLDGATYDVVTDFRGDKPIYDSVNGASVATDPSDETFWVATNGPGGEPVLDWQPEAGDWRLVVMNGDGSDGVVATVTAAAQVRFIPYVAAGLVLVGLVLAGAAVALLIGGVAGYRSKSATPTGAIVGVSPVMITGELDPQLSRGLWLIKWFLAIPHFIVLAVLSAAMVVLTLIAGVSIIFTGRYPRGMFDFNVGVLRWSWRVAFYATGVIGTDQYPPFTLERSDYPAELDVAYPERLSRGLVFVKWLLAIPHLIIVAILANGIASWTERIGDATAVHYGTGLIELLAIVAGFMLLFTGRYPRPMFDLLMGLHRWTYRVVAYVALMTDEYPPFRLDQGGSEPAPPDGTGGGDRTQQMAGTSP